MGKIGYIIAKIKSKLARNNYEIMNDYYRKCGVKIGESVLICTDISKGEPYLIEIGSGTTISTEVAFVTHDYSIRNLSKDFANLFGKIKVGNNCFVGERAVLMYGVTLADNIIVAAGSVVTKSFKEENVIIGGNPARIIGTWEKFYEKEKEKSISRSDILRIINEDPEKLVSR